MLLAVLACCRLFVVATGVCTGAGVAGTICATPEEEEMLLPGVNGGSIEPLPFTARLSSLPDNRQEARVVAALRRSKRAAAAFPAISASG